MCRVFSRLDPEGYASQTRSVRLGGHVTSIRLEASYWEVLEEIAAGEKTSLGRFLTKLHDEVLAYHGEVQNFTSLLRCSCLVYERERADAARGQRRQPTNRLAKLGSRFAAVLKQAV